MGFDTMKTEETHYRLKSVQKTDDGTWRLTTDTEPPYIFIIENNPGFAPGDTVMVRPPYVDLDQAIIDNLDWKPKL